MGILNELRAKVQRVQDGLADGSLIRTVMETRGEDILEKQKIQLLRGLSSSGDDIHPFYSEDLKPEGRFYSVETAGRYAALKLSLSYPYSVDRNPDAPNLYFNGRFHDDLAVVFDSESVSVVGTTGYARGIISKYGLGTFGLMPEYWNEIWAAGAFADLLAGIKSELYG